MVVAHCTGTNSILGQADSELTLKVCGTSLDGQVIRLKSPKCTVGSGRNCTLRLRGRGLQSLHCLIIRGQGQTVVRRVSSDTRLNGRTFFDAPLVVGDRLSFGAVEFEVLPATDMPVSTVDHEPAKSTEKRESPQKAIRRDIRAIRHRARRLLAALRTARGQQSAAEAECQRLAERSRVHTAELASLRTAIQAHEQQHPEGPAKYEAALAALREEVAALQDRIEKQRRDSDASAEESQRLLNQRSEDLAQQTAMVEALRVEAIKFEDQRTRWELHQQELRTEYETQAAELARLERLLADRDEELLNLRAQLDTAGDEALSIASAETAKLQVSLDDARNELATARNHWQSSLDSLTESRHVLQAELAAKETEFAGERDRWSCERAELLEAHHQVYETLEAAQQELARQQHATVQADTHQQVEEALERQRLELQQQVDTLAAERAAFEADRAELDARRGELQQAAAALHASEQTENVSDPVATGEPSSADDVAFEPTNADAASPNSELMARLRETMDWTDDNDSAQGVPQISADGAETASLATSSALDVTRQHTAASTPESWRDEDDEESIDEYMSALMSRMNSKGRNEVPASQGSPAAKEKSPSKPVKELSITQDSDTVQAKAEPFDMLPRRLPPELTSNLAAMRELANSSARSAIDRSAQRRWGQAALGKLTVGVVAMACSAILMWMSPDYIDVFFLGSCLAMVIAVFWTLQSAILYRNVLHAKRIYSVQRPGEAQSNDGAAGGERTDGSGDEPAAAIKA